jgi:hypothetical protein
VAGASAELGIAVAFAAALALTLALTPLARGLAVATGTYDDPVGYKRHPHATPLQPRAALPDLPRRRWEHAGGAAGDQLGRGHAVRRAILCAVLGIAVIAVLEGPRWAPVSRGRSA